MIRLYTLLFLCLPLFFSCKSASKAYEQGNYEDAIERAIKKLQKDPSDRESRDLLQRSYKFAVEQHEEKVRSLSNSNSDYKWEQMINEYIALQRLYNIIRQYPSAASAVRATDYSGYIETYKDKAAEVHLQKAQKWMDEETRHGYREAYNEFRAALSFRPDDFEIRKLMEEAYNAALVRVVVVLADATNGNIYSNSSFQMGNFQDQMIRNLNQNFNNSFVRFYSSQDPYSREFRPDEILEMRLGRITIGQPYDQQQARQVSKEVVTKEIVYRKDSVIKEYTKVFATINVVNRMLVSGGDLYITARDGQNRTLWSDNFVGEHRWNTEFATYTGDERALTDKDKTLISRKPNIPPAPEMIVNEIMRQIEGNLVYRLKTYYQKYP